jgi:6-pyruvoyltetrahydropterin/6-carboxytetrahydropterin synthase
MNISIARIIEFDAGHRLWKHESKCANMHGHRYRIEVHVSADELDSVGRVIDFSVIKEVLGGWIDKNWDHGFLYSCEDDDCSRIFGSSYIGPGSSELGKYYVMPYNPTAENIGFYLLDEIIPDLFVEYGGVGINKLVVHETPNCRAEVLV